MSGLHFSISDLITEVRTISAIGKSFLEPGSAERLLSLASQIQYLQTSARSGSTFLTVSDVRTVPSREFEAGSRRGGVSVYAVISGKWEVRQVVPRGRRPRIMYLEFCGIASTKIEVFDSQTTQRLAMWRMELGASDAPGCYFHTQILGENEEVPFPKKLSVPRLPNIFPTPMGALEFVLGELFQDRWRLAAMADSGNSPRWRSLQKQLLSNLLQWKLDKVENGMSSPWMSLKGAIPDYNLFID